MRFFRRKRLEGKTAQEWFELALRETYLEMRVKYFSNCLEIAPNRADAWFNMGEALRNLRRYEEAINCFDKALEINPKDKIHCGMAWSSKGHTFRDWGRLEEAINCFDKALEFYQKSPFSVYAWHSKGFVFVDLGRYEEAIGCFDKALELDPKDVLAWIGKGTALNYLGRYEEVIRCYDKALNINPEDESAKNNKKIVEEKLRHEKGEGVETSD